MITCIENEQARNLPFVFPGRFAHRVGKRSPRMAGRAVESDDTGRSSSADRAPVEESAIAHRPIAPLLLALAAAKPPAAQTQTPAFETDFEQEPTSIKLEPELEAKALATATQHVQPVV